MACAERVVSALWRSRRARRFETAHLNVAAEKAERLRAELDGLDDDLASCESEREAVYRIINPTTLPLELLLSASAGIVRIARRYGEIEEWRETAEALSAAIPSCKRVSRAKVEAFAIIARDEMTPYFEPPQRPPDHDLSVWPTPSVTMAWIWRVLGDMVKSLRLKRGDVERSLEKAAAWNFLLRDDLELGERRDYDREAGPAKALADAESRLDRQVSRAIADLKAARDLRIS